MKQHVSKEQLPSIQYLVAQFIFDIRRKLLHTYQLRPCHLQMLRRMFRINTDGLIKDSDSAYEKIVADLDQFELEAMELAEAGKLSYEAIELARMMLMISNNFIITVKLRAAADIKDVLPLPAKVINALRNEGINTLRDFLLRPRAEIKKINNFGKISLKIMDNFLSRFGLSWGMSPSAIKRKLSI